MTKSEQRFWDAAFIALVAHNEGVDECFVRSIEGCAGIATSMLAERRKRIEAASHHTPKGDAK